MTTAAPGRRRAVPRAPAEGGTGDATAAALAMPAQPRPWEWAVVVTAALLIAALGWRQSAEFSVHMAFDSVALAPPGTPFARFYLAGGMDVDSFRPLAVLLVRLLSTLGSPLDPWLGLVKALLAVPCSAAVLWWARQRGLGRLAVPVALLAAASPPGTFNSWHLSEFDLLGMALILLADCSLLLARRRPRAPARRLAFAAAAPAVCALMLKDSLAVLCVVFLLLALLDERAETGRWDGLAGRVTAGCSAALLVWLLARPPEPAWWDGDSGAAFAAVLGGLWRGWVVACSQVVALVGPAGVLAVVLAAAGPRLPPSPILALSLAVLAVPEPFRTSFFGCFVFDGPAWPAVLGSAFLLACARLATGAAANPLRAVARPILLSIAAFSLLPAIFRMRADVSARVFLPIVPALFALVLASAWAVARDGGRARIAAATLLAGSMAWGALASGLESGALMLVQDRVELDVKRALVDRLDGPAVLLPRNRIRETTPEELYALRGERLPSLPQLRFLRLTWPAECKVAEAPLRQAGLALPDLARGGRTILTTSLDTFVVDQPAPPRRLRPRDRPDGGRGPWPFPVSWIDDAWHLRWSVPRDAASWFAGQASVTVLAARGRRFVLPPQGPSDLLWRVLDRRPLVDLVEVRGEAAAVEPAR